MSAFLMHFNQELGFEVKMYLSSRFDITTSHFVFL